MAKKYKYVIKNKKLLTFIHQLNIVSNIQKLKYKTTEKITEYIYHYGWNNIHLYAIGTYTLNNGIKIYFDYCYEIDVNNIYNIKKIIYYNLYLM